MREIKFRGKRVCDGLWLYGNLIQSNVGNITINGTNKYCRVDPKTVGQYTGLHDKNGEEIYEGDILKYISIVLQKPIFFTVMWSGDYNYSAFVAKNDNEFYLLSDLTLSDCEIAGNIHENKLEELQ